MRLSYLEFKRPEKFGDNASTSTISTEIFGVMEFQPKSGTVTVGKEIFPLSSVQRMRSVNGEICPDCGLDFEDARALGAHRKHKHGVDSTFGILQTCPDCGEQFKNIKSHQRFKHRGAGK